MQIQVINEANHISIKDDTVSCGSEVTTNLHGLRKP